MSNVDRSLDFSEEATVKPKSLTMRKREPGKEDVISGTRKAMFQGLDR